MFPDVNVDMIWAISELAEITRDVNKGGPLFLLRHDKKLQDGTPQRAIAGNDACIIQYRKSDFFGACFECRLSA